MENAHGSLDLGIFKFSQQLKNMDTKYLQYRIYSKKKNMAIKQSLIRKW